MATQLTVLAGLAFGAWWVIFALVWVLQPRALRRPADLPPGVWPVATAALAALLVQPYRRIAPAGTLATLLDLASRGIAPIDPGDPPSVRVPSSAPVLARLELTDYERHVLDHVAARAKLGGGSVPLDALRMGSPRQTQAWQRRFVELVGLDGRRRGLVADRSPRWARITLRLALLLPLGLLWAAVDRAAFANEPNRFTALVFPAFVLAGCARAVALLRRPVPRGDGVAAAAACRALRARPTPAGPDGGDVADGGDGADGGARGAAFATAVRRGRIASPFAWRNAGRAVWSTRTGTWRPIRLGRSTSVADQRKTPVIAVVGAVSFAAVWAALLVLLASMALEPPVGPVWLLFLAGALALAWVTALAMTMQQLRRTAADRRLPPRTVTGPVVHLESHIDGDGPDTFLAAIDDGTSAPATRYPIGKREHDTLRLGDWLRLTVTARRGRVVRVEVLPRPAALPHDIANSAGST